MVWSTFFTSKWAISCFFWESEHLPGWFVHFLAHFGNVKNRQQNRARKKCSTMPDWQRGEGGWKLFGQCPHGNNTYHKGCLHCQCWHWIYDQCFTLIKIRWTKVNNGFCSTRTQGHTAVCKAKYIQLHVLVYSFAPYFQIVYLYRCTHQGHQVSTRWAADVGPNLCHPWGKVAFRRI